MIDTAADILTELVDPNGNVVTMPTFRRPTDVEWAADLDAAVEMNSAAEADEIWWMEQNDIGSNWFCSVDRTAVTIRVVGTSETASCPSGHRWLRTFGEHDGWRQVG